MMSDVCRAGTGVSLCRGPNGSNNPQNRHTTCHAPHISVYLCVCMSICMSVCLYVCLYVCMFVCLCVCMFVCLCVCVSVYLYVYMYVCMSVCLYACVSVCLYVCVSVYLCICMSICMSVCLYVCVSVCLCVCMSICLYVCMSVCELCPGGFMCGVMLFANIRVSRCHHLMLTCTCSTIPSHCITRVATHHTLVLCLRQHYTRTHVYYTVALNLYEISPMLAHAVVSVYLSSVSICLYLSLSVYLSL